MIRRLLALCPALLLLISGHAALAQEATEDAIFAWEEANYYQRYGEMEKTRKYLVDACEGNHARGCFALAAFALEGKGGAVDLPLARKSAERACDMAHWSACFVFGNMAMQGEGGKVDNDAARMAHSDACSADVNEACNSLAMLLEQGLGGGKDVARALGLYDRACKAGNEIACDNLAKARSASASTRAAPPAGATRAAAPPPSSPDYRNGLIQFNNKQYASAYRMLRPFAERGDAQAEYTVGWMLAYEQGTSRDYLSAARFLASAARKGDRDAEKILGQIAPNVQQAAFVHMIDTEGPDMSDLGNFSYEVEVYCRFGGRDCSVWRQRYRQAEAANNRRAFTEQMRRAWTTQTTTRSGIGNDPRRGGETFGACIRRQARTRGVTAGSTLLDFDCF